MGLVWCCLLLRFWLRVAMFTFVDYGVWFSMVFAVECGLLLDLGGWLLDSFGV